MRGSIPAPAGSKSSILIVGVVGVFVGVIVRVVVVVVVSNNPAAQPSKAPPSSICGLFDLLLPPDEYT